LPTPPLPLSLFFQNAWWSAVFAKILGVFLSLFWGFPSLFCFVLFWNPAAAAPPLITYKIDSWL